MNNMFVKMINSHSFLNVSNYFFPTDMFQSIVTSTRKEAFSGPIKSTSSVFLDEEGPEEKDC